MSDLRLSSSVENSAVPDYLPALLLLSSNIYGLVVNNALLCVYAPDTQRVHAGLQSRGGVRHHLVSHAAYNPAVSVKRTIMCFGTLLLINNLWRPTICRRSCMPFSASSPAVCPYSPTPRTVPVAHPSLISRASACYGARMRPVRVPHRSFCCDLRLLAIV